MKKILLALPLFFALNACAFNQEDLVKWYNDHKDLTPSQIEAAARDCKDMTPENIDWVLAQIAQIGK